MVAARRDHHARVTINGCQGRGGAGAACRKCKVEDKEHLNQVNAHVLHAILDAAQDRAIVASRDIYDENGVKLLAHSMPLTGVLQQRLLERRLRVPLEASLRFEAGLDKNQLRSMFTRLMDSGHALVSPLRPWARDVDTQITSLPLDPVVQFLLTTMQTNTPRVFEHAIQAMALAGALVARTGAGPGDIRQAMLAGLLHDLGELYLDPALIGAGDVLDLHQYRQVATHPRLGESLLSGLAHYPLALSQAVAEHHERLDGSGYPAMRQADRLSTLGRMLCVVEATLGILALPGQGWARASFALRVIPGEFDSHWMGLVVRAAADMPLPGNAPQGDALERAWAGLGRSSESMQLAADHAARLAGSTRPVVREAAQSARHLLERLRAGWNDIGLWAGAAGSGQSAEEVVMADEELRYRLGALERNCLWHLPQVGDADTRELAPLWVVLGA